MGRHKQQTGEHGAEYKASIWSDKKGCFSCRIPKPLLNPNFKEISGFFKIDVEKQEIEFTVVAWIKRVNKLGKGLVLSAEDNAP